MSTHHSLRKQLIRAFWAYLLVLGAGVLGFSLMLHEEVEAVVWESLLEAEMSHFLDSNRYQQVSDWPSTETLQLYRLDDHAPEVLRSLTPGLHDELDLEGRQSVVLVEEHDGQRFAMALDIDDLEASEVTLGVGAVLVGLLLMCGLGALMVFGLNKLFAPMVRLAGDIGKLEAGAGGKISVEPSDSAESAAIADAVNGLLKRNADLLERERQFLQTASHELHTPLTVISGALEVLQSEPADSARREQALRRVAETAQQSMHLVTALMLLGESPDALMDDASTVDLCPMLRAQLAQVAELAAERDLSFELALADAEQHPVTVPAQALELLVRQLLLQTLRDARGVIEVQCQGSALCLRFAAPELNATALAEAYRRSVQRSSALGGLLSNELLQRLAHHLGWQLDYQLGDASDAVRSVCLRLDGATQAER